MILDIFYHRKETIIHGKINNRDSCRRKLVGHFVLAYIATGYSCLYSSATIGNNNYTPSTRQCVNGALYWLSRYRDRAIFVLGTKGGLTVMIQCQPGGELALLTVKTTSAYAHIFVQSNIQWSVKWLTVWWVAGLHVEIKPTGEKKRW